MSTFYIKYMQLIASDHITPNGHTDFWYRYHGDKCRINSNFVRISNVKLPIHINLYRMIQWDFEQNIENKTWPTTEMAPGIINTEKVYYLLQRKFKPL